MRHVPLAVGRVVEEDREELAVGDVPLLDVGLDGEGRLLEVGLLRERGARRRLRAPGSLVREPRERRDPQVERLERLVHLVAEELVDERLREEERDVEERARGVDLELVVELHVPGPRADGQGRVSRVEVEALGGVDAAHVDRHVLGEVLRDRDEPELDLEDVLDVPLDLEEPARARAREVHLDVLAPSAAPCSGRDDREPRSGREVVPRDRERVDRERAVLRARLRGNRLEEGRVQLGDDLRPRPRELLVELGLGRRGERQGIRGARHGSTEREREERRHHQRSASHGVLRRFVRVLAARAQARSGRRARPRATSSGDFPVARAR